MSCNCKLFDMVLNCSDSEANNKIVCESFKRESPNCSKLCPNRKSIYRFARAQSKIDAKTLSRFCDPYLHAECGSDSVVGGPHRGFEVEGWWIVGGGGLRSGGVGVPIGEQRRRRFVEIAAWAAGKPRLRCFMHLGLLRAGNGGNKNRR